MPMKCLPFLIGFLLSSCSVLRITRNPGPAHKSQPEKRIYHHVESPKKTSSKDVKGTAWELLSESQLALQFKNVDSDSYLTVIIEPGVTEKEIPSGHWELTGFEVEGTSYQSMNTSKKFVMRTKSKQRNYGGSLLLGCPKVTSEDFSHLKQMKFFDRYPFSSSKGLCELVVGNNMISVRNHLRKTKKLKRLNLNITF